MPKNYKDDEYDGFVSGDIDDVFELDQTALEEETEDDEIDAETRNKYMIDDDDADYEDYEEEPLDEDIPVDHVDDSITPDEKESENEIVTPEQSTTEETTPDESIVDEEERKVETRISSEENSMDVSTVDQTKENDNVETKQEVTVESNDDTDSSDFEGDTLSKIEIKEDVSQDVIVIDEKDEEKSLSEIIKENETSDDEEPSESIDEVIQDEKVTKNEDQNIPNIETPEDVEAEVKNKSDDKSYAEFMVTSFSARVDAYYNRYSEKDIVTYLEKFNTPEDKAVIKDLYITEYVKYSQFIDFEKDPMAKQDIWVLVCGMFADTIEHEKQIGKIKTEVIQTKEIVDPRIKEDPNIEETKYYQKKQNEKYEKLRIDRTIFDIRDDEDAEKSSIFDDKRTLDRDFYESEFYKIHKEVMTSDRYADMSQISSKVIINIDTSYIPVIDYSSGIRVICIDTNDTDQYRLNPMLIHRKVPFSFRVPFRDVKLRVMYSDNAKHNPHATATALKKIVAYKYINERYKIKLNRNYTIAYTLDPKFIELFENGDPDSKRAESSYNYSPKPFNCQLGVIVLTKKTDEDRKSIRRNQIRRDIGKYEKPSVDDYDIQFVLSARIVKNDLRLRNPSLPPEERYVEYIITQYTETNSVIIEDGFQVITACIIKEHIEHYGRGVGYAVSYEYDRDGLVTPAVVSMLDARDGVAPQLGTRPNALDVEGLFTLPPSRLKMDGVFPFEKGRLDRRNFSPITIQRRYPRDLWANYDLSTNDGRFEFIRSRGFEEFIHMKPIVFDVEPSALNMIYSSDMIRNITKVSMDALRDRNSADTEAILYKQSELEYINSLGDNSYGTFHRMLFTAFDYILDNMNNKNK